MESGKRQKCVEQNMAFLRINGGHLEGLWLGGLAGASNYAVTMQGRRLRFRSF